jgi:endonuclease YncB( thermonuclease family)
MKVRPVARLAILVAVAQIVAFAQTERLTSRDVYVLDGDTIRARGFSYRLTGFDAPEIGKTAQCERKVKGHEGKTRFVDLI